MKKPTGADLRHAADEEILAALLGRVSPATIERARCILDVAGGYPALSKTTLRELVVCEGVGPATASRIQAAVELGRRSLTRPLDRGDSITCSRQVAAYIGPMLVDAEQEIFLVLMMDTKHKVIDLVEISRGSLDSTIVHPREVFRPGVKLGASNIVAVHNHPSGDPTPSAEDRAITTRLAMTGEVVGIELLDHVIVARDGHYSFRDQGEM